MVSLRLLWPVSRAGPTTSKLFWTTSLVSYMLLYAGYPLHRKNRENGRKKSLSRKTGILEVLPKHKKNTGNFVCSSPEDSPAVLPMEHPYSEHNVYDLITLEGCFTFFFLLHVPYGQYYLN